MKTHTYTALLNWALSGYAYVPYIRHHGQARNYEPATWPKAVRDYLALDTPEQPRQSHISRDTLLELEPHSELLRVTKPNNVQRIVTFRVPAPDQGPSKAQLLREAKQVGGPIIRDLKGLMQFLCAERPDLLNKRIYKSTGCGASISVRRPDGTWLHNGREGWDTLTAIDAFTIQTIVEGSDATVVPEPFLLPVATKSVDDWITEMEFEAQSLWDEANTDTGDDEVQA